MSLIKEACYSVKKSSKNGERTLSHEFVLCLPDIINKGVVKSEGICKFLQ